MSRMCVHVFEFIIHTEKRTFTGAMFRYYRLKHEAI